MPPEELVSMPYLSTFVKSCLTAGIKNRDNYSDLDSFEVVPESEWVSDKVVGSYSADNKALKRGCSRKLSRSLSFFIQSISAIPLRTLFSRQSSAWSISPILE